MNDFVRITPAESAAGVGNFPTQSNITTEQTLTTPQSYQPPVSATTPMANRYSSQGASTTVHLNPNKPLKSSLFEAAAKMIGSNTPISGVLRGGTIAIPNDPRFGPLAGVSFTALDSTQTATGGHNLFTKTSTPLDPPGVVVYFNNYNVDIQKGEIGYSSLSLGHSLYKTLPVNKVLGKLASNPTLKNASPKISQLIENGSKNNLLKLPKSFSNVQYDYETNKYKITTGMIFDLKKVGGTTKHQRATNHLEKALSNEAGNAIGKNKTVSIMVDSLVNKKMKAIKAVANTFNGAVTIAKAYGVVISAGSLGGAAVASQAGQLAAKKAIVSAVEQKMRNQFTQVISNELNKGTISFTAQAGVSTKGQLQMSDKQAQDASGLVQEGHSISVNEILEAGQWFGGMAVDGIMAMPRAVEEVVNDIGRQPDHVQRSILFHNIGIPPIPSFPDY